MAGGGGGGGIGRLVTLCQQSGSRDGWISLPCMLPRFHLDHDPHPVGWCHSNLEFWSSLSVNPLQTHPFNGVLKSHQVDYEVLGFVICERRQAAGRRGRGRNKEEEGGGGSIKINYATFKY